MKSRTDFSLILPVYNEESVIEETYNRAKSVLQSLSRKHEIIFVNDGSTDRSAWEITRISQQDCAVKLVNFSRKFGPQASITAGLTYASGNAVIIMDANSHTPPELIATLVEQWKQGYDIVYGVNKRRKDKFSLKPAAVYACCYLLEKMTSLNIWVVTGDFWLLDCKVKEAITSCPEHRCYMRGLMNGGGFNQKKIEFANVERPHAKRGDSLTKLLRLVQATVVSLSCKPLRLPFYLGVVFMLACALISTQLFIDPFHLHLAKSQLFLFAVFQMLIASFVFIFIGIQGEFLSEILEESRIKPLYVVNDVVGFEQASYGGGSLTVYDLESQPVSV